MWLLLKFWKINKQIYLMFRGNNKAKKKQRFGLKQKFTDD